MENDEARNGVFLLMLMLMLMLMLLLMLVIDGAAIERPKIDVEATVRRAKFTP